MVLIDVKEQLSGEDVVAFTVSPEFTVATLVGQRNPTTRLQLRYFSFVILVFIIAFVLSVCSICISVCAYLCILEQCTVATLVAPRNPTTRPQLTDGSVVRRSHRTKPNSCSLPQETLPPLIVYVRILYLYLNL